MPAFLFFFRNDPSITDSNERTDIVELLEAIAYLICQDDPVTPESYHRILSSRCVANSYLAFKPKG